VRRIGTAGSRPSVDGPNQVPVIATSTSSISGSVGPFQVSEPTTVLY
jgi:hypothetical protein